jgi:hypothetical protein
MGNVVSLHAERWINAVFEEAGLRVDVSTKGRVRFSTAPGDLPVLSMEQMARLGEALSVAYAEDEEDDDGQPDQAG